MSARDLFVTSHTPALGSGRALRTHLLIRALAAHRPLDVLYVRFGAAEPDAELRGLEAVELTEVRPSRGLRRLQAFVGARRRGVPPGLARAVSPELRDAAERLSAAAETRRVIADGPTAAAALLELADRRQLIYSAHNLESAFRHELRESNRREVRMLAAFETMLLERFAESWMVSEADLVGAAKLQPGARLRYVPNVVDVDAIAPVEPDQGVRRAVFVASFSYEPNRVALSYLLEQVMPRVWSELPEAKLAVAGAGLDPSHQQDPRIELLGFVDDLHALYASASCAVVPLLQGGGSPLKLIEALAHGLPVLATRRAVAGLSLSPGVDCLLADHPDEFAATLVEVLREGASSIGRAGRERAERCYSLAVLREIVAP